MRLCFVVADARAQHPSYTGIYLAHAASWRGHDVSFVSVDDLSFLDDNSVLATTRRVRHGAYATPADYARALSSDEAVLEEDTLGSFDVVFLRYNPTRESLGKLASPVLDFGWRVRLGGTLVINDPEGLRRAGSRLYLADFPADVRAGTFISRSPKALKEFLRSLPGAAVLKPLAPRGGEHVFYVKKRQVSNLNQIITTVTKDGYAIAQEYLPEIEQGEKRLLLLDGEPVRVGSQVAIYRRHTVLGGKNSGQIDRAGVRTPCDFGPAEARIAALLRPKLLADGLSLVGVDMVGDKLLELNVYTPGGLHSLHALYGVDVAAAMIEHLEARVRLRTAYRTTFDPEATDLG